MNCIKRIFNCCNKTDNKTDNKIDIKITDFINQKKNNYMECVICLEEMKYNEKLSIIMCSHIFHKHCLDKWKNRKRLCPLCDYEF